VDSTDSSLRDGDGSERGERGERVCIRQSQSANPVSRQAVVG